MKAEIKDGKLIIELPLLAVPERSKSGRTWAIAEFKWADAKLEYRGVPVFIQVGAYVKKEL